MVERLRAAGAVILGLGVTPGMGGRLIPGDQVPDLPDHPRNPWDLARVPGSSSAGVAAATAAGLVTAGIGGDDGGSTRLPAALSGLVGFHASRGRIPHVDYQRQGHNLTQSAGPLARDVRDAAQVMQVIAGPDARQFITRDEPAPDYVGELDRGVAGLRIAWTDDFGLGEAYPTPGADRIVQAVREAAHRFTALGAQMNVIDERWEDFWPANLVTGKAYGYSLSARGEAPPSPMALQAALEQRARTYATFAGVLSRHDLLISPTVPMTAPTVEEWDRAWNRQGARFPHGSFSPTWTQDTYMLNWIGWPAMSVPCGFVDGLPIGMQIIAPPWREASIFQAAAAYLEAYPLGVRPPMAMI